MLEVDAICPLFNADKYIDRLIFNFQNQKNIVIHPVFPITRTENTESIINKIKAAGYTYFFVEPNEFSHSLTREKAMKEYCTRDLVLFLSQDVNMYKDDAAYELASVVNDDIVYAFGKQVCKKKTIEYYTRKKNYGDVSYIDCKDDVSKHQLLTFFGSDAFAVYNRKVFLKLNGYDNINMMMSEDMYYVKKILDAGYKKAYVATAIVEHYHTFTLKQIYNRYYETGKWFKQHPEFDVYKTNDSGMKLAFYVLGQAFKDFNIPVIFKWLPNMSARWFGMRKGKKIIK